MSVNFRGTSSWRVCLKKTENSVKLCSRDCLTCLKLNFILQKHFIRTHQHACQQAEIKSGWHRQSKSIHSLMAVVGDHYVLGFAPALRCSCSCQSLVDYENTQTTQSALKVSESSDCWSWSVCGRRRRSRTVCCVPVSSYKQQQISQKRTHFFLIFHHF